MREWSKADRYVAPDLAAIQALIGEGGFDEVVQLTWRHRTASRQQRSLAGRLGGLGLSLPPDISDRVDNWLD